MLAGALAVSVLSGCSSHSQTSSASTTSTTIAHPASGLTAATDPNGAASLAADFGCTHFDPLATKSLPVSFGASGAGTCSLGSTTVLVITFSNPFLVAAALRAAGGLGAVAGTSVYVAQGPNWLAAGTNPPSQAIASRIVAKVGGQVKKAGAPGG
jgi:hypothetical protein